MYQIHILSYIFILDLGIDCIFLNKNKILGSDAYSKFWVPIPQPRHWVSYYRCVNLKSMRILC